MAKKKYFSHVVSNLKQDRTTSVKIQSKLIRMSKSNPDFEIVSELADLVEMVRWNLTILTEQLDTVIDKVFDQLDAINSDRADTIAKNIDMNAVKENVIKDLNKMYFPSSK